MTCLMWLRWLVSTDRSRPLFGRFALGRLTTPTNASQATMMDRNNMDTQRIASTAGRDRTSDEYHSFVSAAGFGKLEVIGTTASMANLTTTII